MRPYAVEGLDCSGKKTIARLVQQQLRGQGIDASIVIGPLVGGRLGRLDARLANIITTVPRGGVTDLLRRSLYVTEPVIDWLCYRPGLNPVVKVSTHFRAWARSLIERDRLMTRGYALTAAVQIRFVGATLLSTDFYVRLQRHNADVAAGRTTKVASRRFLGPDPTAFAAWHQALDQIMDLHVPRMLRLDSTAADPAQLAKRIAEHAAACWSEEP